MEKIASTNDLNKLKNNHIICQQENIQITNSIISFLGTNNFLVVEKDASIINSRISFKGSNSIIFIKKTKNNRINMIIDIYSDSFFFMDKGCSINMNIKIIISENKNIIIGKDCMFSQECWIRNSDGHLIYDIESCKRVNISRNIVIGDHVWIGQNVSIIKSPFIGSGSILGMGSVVKSRVQSNSIYAGNPSILQKESIFWDRTSAQPFSDFETTNSLEYKNSNSDYIFKGVDNSSYWQSNINEIASINDSLTKIKSISSISDLDSLIIHCPPKKQNKFFNIFLKK